MEKDNSTFALKVELRQRALLECSDEPIVLEGHAGFGKIFAWCYGHIESGIAFERDVRKIASLAKQRRGWTVYEGDCVAALAAGFGNHLPVNFLDLDPYGEPWPALDAFLESDRPKPARLVLCVNDGLRQVLKISGGWKTASMQPVIERFGNGLFADYLDVCRFLVEEKAAKAGYSLTRWTGYYCGSRSDITHYAAVLTK